MTQELRKLAERLSADRETVLRIDAEHAGEAILSLLDRLEKAEKAMEQQKDEWLSWHAKREQLEKDAERYRWLKGDGKYMAVDSFKGFYRVIDKSVDLVVTEWLDSFDEAIDAAMEAK